MSESLCLPIRCVCSWWLYKLSTEIWHLKWRWYNTPGLDVVLWQNVDPVGGRLGGNLDLYRNYLGGGRYYFGMIL